MNNKKIDEIGEKLNVNSSEIEPTKSPNWFKKNSLWMIHTTNFVLSSLMGLIFGLISLNDPYMITGTYPYMHINSNRYKAFWGVISINLVNGIITIPQKRYFNLGRMIRIGIFILNFIVSLTLSHFIYNSLISLIPPQSLGYTPLYSVYKSPAVIIDQNTKLTRKIII